ncbi:MAG: phosphoribosyl-ATP diphosphatase [Methanosarcinaceae archaeon]|nr:phosphoribosyl-ATP diphosphatase [Methanosarcinaceae archaeon]
MNETCENIIDEIYKTIEKRQKEQPEGSYVCRILNDEKGINKILEKVGEECTETILAVKDGKKEEIIYETSDLIFHLLLMLFECGVKPEEIEEELKRRHG